MDEMAQQLKVLWALLITWVLSPDPMVKEGNHLLELGLWVLQEHCRMCTPTLTGHLIHTVIINKIKRMLLLVGANFCVSPLAAHLDSELVVSCAKLLRVERNILQNFKSSYSPSEKFKYVPSHILRVLFLLKPSMDLAISAILLLLL